MGLGGPANILIETRYTRHYQVFEGERDLYRTIA